MTAPVESCASSRRRIPPAVIPVSVLHIAVEPSALRRVIRPGPWDIDSAAVTWPLVSTAMLSGREATDQPRDAVERGELAFLIACSEKCAVHQTAGCGDLHDKRV